MKVLNHFLIILIFFSCFSCANNSSNEALIIDQVLQSSTVPTTKEFVSLIKNIKDGSSNSRDESMDADVALELIETVLNKYYTRSSQSAKEIDFSVKSIIEFDLNDFKILNEDLTTAFDVAYQKISDHYSSTNESTKIPIAFDIKILEHSSSYVKFSLESFLSVGAPNNVVAGPCGGFFEDTDNWNCCEKSGYCYDPDGPNNIFEGIYDAADIFTKEINNRAIRPEGHSYYTEIESVEVVPFENLPIYIGNPSDNVQLDGYRDFLLWAVRGQSQFFNYECLFKQDMVWYFCNIQELIETFKPIGKEFSHILVEDITTFNDLDVLEVFHQATIFYGVSNQCSCGPCPPNTNPFECEECC